VDLIDRLAERDPELSPNQEEQTLDSPTTSPNGQRKKMGRRMNTKTHLWVSEKTRSRGMNRLAAATVESRSHSVASPSNAGANCPSGRVLCGYSGMI
jgi:hypothetical protein